jgi:hypothetical protein
MLAKKREEERQIAVEYHCKSFTVSRRIHCITKAWLDMIPLINPWSSTFFAPLRLRAIHIFSIIQIME